MRFFQKLDSNLAVLGGAPFFTFFLAVGICLGVLALPDGNPNGAAAALGGAVALRALHLVQREAVQSTEEA